MYRLMLFASGLSLVLACSSAAAAESLEAIVSQQRQLAAQLGEEGSRLSPRERALVREAQSEVFALAEGRHSLSDLNSEQQARLANALELIRATVHGEQVAEAERQVCWRERKVGSQMMVTQCGSQREVAEAREGARGFMQRPRVCVASETASCGALP